MVGQLARCVGLLRHRLQLRQIALECLHAGESVPDGVVNLRCLRKFDPDFIKMRNH
jgi:hypothetical protein